jgi:serine/threonine protein kinase
MVTQAHTLPDPPEEPVILGGRYRLMHQLVEGGMGSVWYAEHLTLRSPVAVKLIAREGSCSEESLQRFLLEARAGAALRSPHVVQIFDYGLHEGLPYIVMELLSGESLADRLDRTGPLSPSTTERVITQVARALNRAHAAGVIHRDLKPENIFLVDDEDDLLVKLLDFGIAKSSFHAFTSTIAGQATRTGTFIGTPRYASPEQVEGVKSLDHRTDIWSMGVVAYECLLGQPPFEGDAVGKIMVEICSQPLPVPSERGHVPEGFDAWFARACAHYPEQRYQSAREAAAELSKVCGGRNRDDLPLGTLALRGPGDGLGAKLTSLAAWRRAAPWVGFALASTAFLVALTSEDEPASEHSPSVAVLPARAPGPEPAAVAAGAAPVANELPAVTPAPTEASPSRATTPGREGASAPQTIPAAAPQLANAERPAARPPRSDGAERSAPAPKAAEPEKRQAPAASPVKPSAPVDKPSRVSDPPINLGI